MPPTKPPATPSNTVRPFIAAATTNHNRSYRNIKGTDTIKGTPASNTRIIPAAAARRAPGVHRSERRQRQHGREVRPKEEHLREAAAGGGGCGHRAAGAPRAPRHGGAAEAHAHAPGGSHPQGARLARPTRTLLASNNNA
eukprot:1194296-Prorocentrum_minimum.AAC.6